jgi:phage gp29-like protein
MAGRTELLDRWGNPIRRQTLTEEIARPSITGIRSPLTGYPADGLTPVRLAMILREADAGDPVRYLGLAETIEERDLHYLGVLGTRKRNVSQLEITVEAATDDQRGEDHAGQVREWLTRGELAEELFDILDAIGKGYSFTEIVWDTSSGQWMPERLEWRDPRWFRFDRSDLRTPRLLDDNGAELPLPGGKFIFAEMKAKSGLGLRSGLARAAAWAWMFKAYTQRDWAIFTQTYGQPLRVGRYGPEASEADKDTLFTAVANIAGDCAAIIPQSMMIEFVEARSAGATTELYEKRADWLDRQISKAVLGQTATTDAVVGGLGSAREHRQVQEDIERADARRLEAILNRDLIAVWMQLEHGPGVKPPRLRIGRPQEEDVKATVDAVARLVPLGLRVSQAEMRDKLGLARPDGEEEILTGSAPVEAADGSADTDAGEGGAADPSIKRVSGDFKRGPGLGRVEGAPPTESALLSEKNGGSDQADATDALTDRLEREAAPAVEELIGRIEAMVDAARDFDELAALIREGFPALDARSLGQVFAMALLAAHAGGRAAAEEDSA